MSNSVGTCNDRCGYLMKALILSLIAGGIVLSVLASQTCEFLRFNVDGGSVTNEMGTEWPLDLASGGWIGMFQYEVIRDANGEVVFDGCISYDQQFLNAPFGALVASQFCAVLAPIFAFLAILVAVSETVCACYGSFIATAILLLTAATIQGGTFSSFANPSFCYETNTQCGVGAAVYYSASASLAFFLACILLCCSPRPVPCCGNSTSDEDVEALPKSPVIDPPKISTNQA